MFLLGGWLHVDGLLDTPDRLIDSFGRPFDGPLFFDIDGESSNRYGKHAVKRRRAVYRFLEKEPDEEWDKSLNCYNIIPASKTCTQEQWSCRFGQVFMAVVQYQGVLLFMMDYQIYHNTNESRSKAYQRDIVTGCLIEALLYHCNHVEKCDDQKDFGDQSLVCFAFPVECQKILDAILPECMGPGHLKLRDVLHGKLQPR